jgi:acetyltransferase-like isoleucine patch superfamily enzyme
MLAESGTRIDIGTSCMIAQGVEIRTGDSHGIFDLASRERINPGKNIRIGSSVWLANGVLVLKGAVIPDGCVVGARSVVTAEFSEPNAVYVGHPARLVRSNIAWGWHVDRFPE